MKLGWLSDIHLNFLEAEALGSFLSGLSSKPADGWIISGDIGEATNIIKYLDLLAEASHVPVYFVLGNHDFYRGSLGGTTGAVKEFVKTCQGLTWLTAAGVQQLGPGVALVGDDGWGDGRLGRPHETTVMLNDFVLIEELRGLGRNQLVEKLNRLGDESAARLRPKLRTAARDNRQVIVATHVPPFGEAAWHEGRLSTADWVPWFACRATGDVLLECADEFPDVEFLVVCGHTHGAGEYRPRANLEVLTAGAEYGLPRVERILSF